MEDLERLQKILKTMSDEDISKVISHGAMKYTDEISQTVSFAFWICHMAEQDLNFALTESWKLGKTAYPEFDHEKVDEQIEKDHKIKARKIDSERNDYNCREVTFGDLIYIRERLYGKTNFLKLLWKLKGLRDDLSHGRINELKYNDQNLLLRSTKEKLIIDYLTLAQEDTPDISPIWNSISEEDKINIKEKFDQMFNP